MRDPKSETLFRWLDRAFWLIWAAFPVLIWLVLRDVMAAPERMAALLPDQASCIAQLPSLATISLLPRVAFWVGVVAEFGVYALLLALAHVVIHRCATGQIFVDGMIRILWRIGMIISVWPVLDLCIANFSNWALYDGGDVATFQPVLALDLPVLGVGLLLVAIAHAMRMAVALQQDAALTI